jgi:hypothetical protein
MERDAGPGEGVRRANGQSADQRFLMSLVGSADSGSQEAHLLG